MRILLLDNYDSFTYNLYDYLMQLGTEVEVFRNDMLQVETIKQRGYTAIVLSPGPKRPVNAGVLMELLDHYHQELPILGICLGHQAIGEYFGAQLKKANRPMHGKTSNITHDNLGIFEGLPHPMQVMRYHSLILEQLPNCLQATAYSPTGEIMALKHQEYPLWGVQFHPESILSPNGLSLLGNWLKLL